MSIGVQVINERCCGLDVHKKLIEACIMTSQGIVRRRFATMTCDLRDLVAWLQEHQIPIVAMESTGSLWKPVYNILEEAEIESLVVNAQHIKAVPGRKTDVKDAEWIASLLRHGLLKPSFIPDRHQRELREMIRYRTSLIQERSREVQRLQKVLEGANIKLSSVISDVVGASGRSMIEAIIEGIETPSILAKMAHGGIKASAEELEKALSGVVSSNQRMVLSMQLRHINFLDKQIKQIDAKMDMLEQENQSFKEALELLDSIPGVGTRIAQTIAIEVGLDMSRFPTAKHLAAWAGMAPGNNESAGKRKPSRTRPGNQHLRSQLVQAAHVIARMKGTYLADQYHRIASRRGKKRAAIAVGHSILIIAYHLLKRHESYRELGANYLTEKRRDSKIRQHLKELQKLGLLVTIQGNSTTTKEATA